MVRKKVSNKKSKGVDYNNLVVGVVVVLLLIGVFWYFNQGDEVELMPPKVLDEELVQLSPDSGFGNFLGMGVLPGIGVGSLDYLLTPEERKLLELINDFRVDNGLSRLNPDIGLILTSKAHNILQVKLGPIDPTKMSDLTHSGDKGTPDYNVNEVVSGGGPFAEDVLQTWLDSKPHKKILLKPETTNIGVAIDLAYGTVQTFP